MPSTKQSLEQLRQRIRSLVGAERRDMCWEIGYFQTPIAVKEPGEAPFNPYMVVCIDTESRAVMGSDLLEEPPSPQDFLTLLVDSMEAPSVGKGGSVIPRSVRLKDSAALKLLETELNQLGTEFELVKALPFLREFAEITEREFFPRLARSGSKHN